MSRLDELNPDLRKAMTHLIGSLASMPSIQNKFLPCINLMILQVRDTTRLEMYDNKNAESDAESDDDAESIDEDDWMDVYMRCSFAKYCENQPQLQKYADCTYYQCWGGGPEGGYLLRRRSEDSEDEVYKVNRTWGEPFTVEPMIGVRGVEVQQTAMTSPRIRII